jgi:hypothetical protein
MRPLTRLTAILLLGGSLGACATTEPQQSGFLTGYQQLSPRKAVGRAQIRTYVDKARVALVKRVAIEPSVLAPGADARAPLTEEERRVVLREVDAQLCFELSERFEIAASPDQADARARAAVIWIEPTGRASSAVSAAASFFIPGPIGVRLPGTLGGLGVEAELVDKANHQIAAIAWARKAMAIGADSPSLSRQGDALQLAEPFADAAGATLGAPMPDTRKYKDAADPCAAYGARFRPTGMATKMITNLYTPDKREAAAPAKPTPR